MRIKIHVAVLSTAWLLDGACVDRSQAASDFCDLTSAAAVRACLMGARRDGLIAMGKCSNLSNAAARNACSQQASADVKDARQSCGDERAFRDAACERLGEAPYDPVIDPASFGATIDNPYFPLRPGTTFIYEGQTAEGFNHTEFAVTHNTKVIRGVTCVEVHDTVKLDGQLAEDTLDWFAQDREGNVWYFGENTHELAGGLITTVHGTFTAGVDGAKPGIVMKAHPAIGDFYRQEFDLGNAEDDAEVVSLSAAVTVPYGSFTKCLDTLETTPLETGLHEHKFYAAGVGQILTLDADTGERLPLVWITTE